MVISGKGQRGSVKGKIIPYIIVTNSILKKTLFRTIVLGEREIELNYKHSNES